MNGAELARCFGTAGSGEPTTRALPERSSEFGPARSHDHGPRPSFAHCGIAAIAFEDSDFDSSSTVSKQEVDENLDEWEMLGVRVRKEAHRLQLQGPTGA